MICFFDSSALAKRYVEEAGTAMVLDLIDRAESVSASRLTWVEITSAVARLVPSDRTAVRDDIIRALDDDFSVLVNILEATPSVMADARKAVLRHQLRTADAIQLASAMTAMSWYGKDVRFVCAGKKLLAAAITEQMEVVEPV